MVKARNHLKNMRVVQLPSSITGGRRMSKYIIENDEVRKYFHQEYAKINIQVVPGHYPNFKTKEEVDKLIEHMKNLEKDFDELWEEEE